MEDGANRRMVRLYYFVHGTSVDNEDGLVSGWFDAELSELGRKQALELRQLIKRKKFDRLFSSDLRRAVDFAKLVFENTPITAKDSRLREIDYGDLTRAKITKVDSNLSLHIEKPFPNGESFREVERRVKDFLDYLAKTCLGMHVAIVAHRAPQLALEVLLNGRTWEQAIQEDWRVKKPDAWRAGWEYVLST